ncbi:hypothetical protein D917_00968 [Trichinella nativa]|uniref:Uncharacterized protein n=1 Tax=Trichinella nativa TaxID=6335 RepID=A0A1Y3EXD5_9BILA|nr:hypothetical protein D917_00968 [Trichinella nativa]
MNTFESVENVNTIIKALKNGYRYMSTKLQQSPILKEFFAKYAVQLKSMPKNDVLITLEFLLREMTSLRDEKITASKALAADAIAEFKRMPDESLLPLIRSKDPHYEFLCQLSEIENAISDAQPAKAVLKLSNLKGEIAALMALKTRQSDFSRLFIECGKVYYCGSGYSVVDMAKMDVEDEQNHFASVADDEQEPSSVLNDSRKENTIQGAQSTLWDSMSDNFRCFARSAAASNAKHGRYMDFKRTSTPKVRMQQQQHQPTGSYSTMDEGMIDLTLDD